MSTNEKKLKMANIMIEFINNTISGHESGFYKMYYFNDSENINTLKYNAMDGMITSSAVNYLNQAYKSLIRENDPYFLKYFKGMAKVMNHSYICLLNIVFVTLINVHRNIDRSKLDIDTYDKYMESIESQLEELLEKIKGTIIQSISHKCTGDDIKNCDPNDDLFIIGEMKN